LVADTTAKMATKNLMAERNLVICRIQDVVSVLIFLLNCNFQKLNQKSENEKISSKNYSV